MFAEIQRDLPWLPLIAIQDTQVCIAWIPYWYTSSKSPTLGCDVQEKDTQNMYILFRYTWCWFSSSQMLESLPYSCRFWCAQTDSKSTPVSKMSLAISFHLTFGKGTCTFPSNPSKFWVSVVPTFHAFAKEFHRRGGFTLTTLHSCDFHKYRSFEAKLQYSPETVEDLFTPSSCTWELVEKKFQVQTPSLWQLAFRSSSSLSASSRCCDWVYWSIHLLQELVCRTRLVPLMPHPCCRLKATQGSRSRPPHAPRRLVSIRPPLILSSKVLVPVFLVFENLMLPHWCLSCALRLSWHSPKSSQLAASAFDHKAESQCVCRFWLSIFCSVCLPVV